MAQLKIIIADDQKMVRKAWNFFVSQMDKVTIVGEASNGSEVIQMLDVNDANLVLMDIDMPVMDGFQTAKIIKEKYPKTKMIALTVYNDKVSVKKMLDAGVLGYITKNSSFQELAEAIATVREGGQYLCSEIKLLLQNDSKDMEVPHLTIREKEIINLVAQGLSSKAIGEKFSLSIKTVESHRRNIYKKLKIKNVVELINYRNNHPLD